MLELLDTPRILGVLTGVCLVAAIEPIHVGWRDLILLKMVVYLAFVLSPFTFFLLSSQEKFVFHAAGVFIASLLNSLVLMPAAFWMNTKAIKGATK